MATASDLGGATGGDGNDGSIYVLRFQGELSGQNLGEIVADGSGLAAPIHGTGETADADAVATIKVHTRTDGTDQNLVDEVQSLKIASDSGTFLLDFAGEITSAITIESGKTLANIIAALNALPSIDTGAGGNVIVTEVLADELYSIRFTGSLGGKDVAKLVARGDAAALVSVVREGGTEAATNSRQIFTVSATSGTYKLSLDFTTSEGASLSVTTDAIRVGATAFEVENALQRAVLGSRFASDITVQKTAGVDGDVYIVNFDGVLRVDGGGGAIVGLLEVADVSSSSVLVTVQSRMDGINYYGIDTLTINTGSGAETVSVQGTTAETILNLGAGDDQVFIASDADLDATVASDDLNADGAPDFDFLSGNLDRVAGSLTVNAGEGRHRLMVSDEDAGAGDGDVLITAGTGNDVEITGLAPAMIAYSATTGDFGDGISYWTSGHADTVTIDETHRQDNVWTITQLNTGDGGDTVIVSLDKDDDGFFALNTQQGDDTVRAGGYGEYAASTLPLVIFGGLGDDAITGGLGNDIIFGDQGRVHYGTGNNLVRLGGGGPGDRVNPTAQPITRIFNQDDDTDIGGGVFSNDGMATDLGGSDVISGNQGDDIILGGHDNDATDTTRPLTDGSEQFGDELHGEAGNDVVLGDSAKLSFTVFGGTAVLTGIESERIHVGGSDVITGGTEDDVLIGGADGDFIDGNLGRDLVFGDSVILDRSSTNGANQYQDYSDPRLRTLDASGELYGTAINGQPDGAALYAGYMAELGLQYSFGQIDPSGFALWRDFDIELLEHNAEAATNTFGDDYIAGGGDNDMIFGQLGDDVIQGDGSIAAALAGTSVGASRTDPNDADGDGAFGPLTVVASFEHETDGDDYIEGNGGDDVIFGNLGQDDIIGDNSDLFSLDEAERAQVGTDVVFGGAGLRIDRNAYVEDTGDISLADRHGRDADMILGDNGRIIRMVSVDAGTGATSYLAFEYDKVDDNPTEHYDAGAALDRSEGERIVVRVADLLDYTPGGLDFHPDALGDFGAADEIHGESGDDFIYGMVGDDLLFGDSEDDDIIAGYGHDWVSGGTGQDGILGGDGRIFTSKNSTTIGESLYGIAPVEQVDEPISSPGDHQQATIHVTNALKKTFDLTPFLLYPDSADPYVKILDDSENDNDIIFGGLGSDFLHGGFGSDAISGAEAMPGVVTFLGETFGTPEAPLPYSFDNPGNPGDILNHGGDANRPDEFAAYDENNPRPMVFVDPTTGFVFTDPTTNLNAVPFVLNFRADDGLSTDTASDGQATDGDDVIFGDLGHDWLVGGTGRDHLYGGFGDDLLNADDDHARADDPLNQSPDTFDSYADIVFGGAGRDIMLANTEPDRLIDWNGEYNSYIVPFGPFGAGTVSRSISPGLETYLYALSAADGADHTRFVDGEGDRNGEPYGEIGLVNKDDAYWGDQRSAPDDPQPGNNSGNKKDALRAETLGDGGEALDASALPAILEEAARRLALMEGLSAAELARLRGIQFTIADLESDLLATENHGVITFDIDAAGHGYFVDYTPTKDEEFAMTGEAIARSGAYGAIDLLTVAMHELGHVLGFDHVTDDKQRAYMSEVLGTSQRLGLLDASATGWFVRAGNGKTAPGVFKSSIDLRPVLAQAAGHMMSFDHLRPHGTAGANPARDALRNTAQVFDEGGGLLLDPEEARLLRVLNFEVSHLLDNEDGLPAEDGSTRPAPSNGTEKGLVRWTETFDGLKSL